MSKKQKHPWKLTKRFRPGSRSRSSMCERIFTNEDRGVSITYEFRNSITNQANDPAGAILGVLLAGEKALAGQELPTITRKDDSDLRVAVRKFLAAFLPRRLDAQSKAALNDVVTLLDDATE